MLPVDEAWGVEQCTLFDSVSGSLQSVAESRNVESHVSAAGSLAVHLGKENLNVARHVARILSGKARDRPFELCIDVDVHTLLDCG